MTPGLEYVRTLPQADLPQLEMPPGDLDPLADGILMAHQKAWVADPAHLKLAEKGRRTGITWAEALDDTLTAASEKAAGGDNVFYIGDTKEKGLEFVATCAHFAQVLARVIGAQDAAVDEVLFEDQLPDGSSRKITAYRIRFASGNQVVALSSRPANVRGLQGIVVIDEAAFHPNVQGVIDAANALIIWGGRIRIISTHNGKQNPFNQLILDTRAGQYAYSLHHIPFDAAVKNGLYERVCLVRGWTPTAAGKAEWYQRIRGAYGAKKAAMREELDVIPRDSAGAAIPSIWIENAMREVRPILRYAPGSDFSHLHENERIRQCSQWIEEVLKPQLQRLDKTREHVFGMDFARYSHLSVIAPLSIEQDLTRRAPFLVEMGQAPSRQQEQILWTLIAGLPRFRAGAMDATGPGLTLAEYTADRFGRSRIIEVSLNDAWYRDNMGLFVRAFEDGVMDLPRDADVANDLRALEVIDGVTKLPKLVKTAGDKKQTRHGDAAIALALGYFASVHTPPTRFEHIRVPLPHRAETEGAGFLRPALDDLAERPVRATHGIRTHRGSW